jgi:hypothetical protein
VSVLLTAIGLFLGTFAASVLFAANSPWRFANYQSIPFPELDPDKIQRQVKGRRFRRPWLEVTLLASAIDASAAVVPEPANLACIIGGIVVVAVFGLLRGFMLFKEGVAELGIEWPPKRRKGV